MDRASAGVLSFVARRLDGSHVGVLGASRTGDEDRFDQVGLPQLDLGLDAALPPVIELESKIGEFGRGERI